MITEPQEAAEYIFKLLDDNKDNLGIKFLGLNERLTPQYPAVVVIPGAKSQQPHSTHLFMVLMNVMLMVYHANLKSSTPDRTRDDLQLCTDIENLLHTDPKMNWSDQVVFAYVSDTTPRVARRPTSEVVVGTQMTVSIESRKGFPYVP